MNHKIEDVAEFLLSRKIEFKYHPKELVVTDHHFKDDLFEYACYHASTGELVLLTNDGSREVPWKEFIEYMKLLTNKS